MTQDPDCIFCKIVAKQIPAKLIAEGDGFVAFADINPQAPSHILVVPTEHRSDITQYSDAKELGALFIAANMVAAQAGLKSGFRLVVNTGADGGQTVSHLHVHLLGGRQLDWPPG